MHIEQRVLTSIQPYPQNPRCHDAAVEPVAESIKNFGWRQPIVVDSDGIIIAGHSRYWAAKLLNLDTVPVHVATDLTPAQVKAYRLADNRSADYATWDDAKLREELAALNDLDIDLALTGFTAEELQTLQGLLQVGEDGPENNDPEVCPEPQAKPVSQRGDLWLLGLHRLYCGDATQSADVAVLLEGMQADLGFTDPPYNVARIGRTDDELTIANDNISEDQFERLLERSLAQYQTHLKSTASLYVFHAWTYQGILQTLLEQQGLVIRNQLIWEKRHFVQNFGRYRYQHEPFFYCYRHGAVDAWYGDKRQTTIWNFEKPGANRLHPTMKPVALVEKALLNSSQPGEIVLDLFGGSGSTLMACARLGRQARLMEIDPKYVDVIIERWQTWSGKPAILASTGQDYATVKQQRQVS